MIDMISLKTRYYFGTKLQLVQRLSCDWYTNSAATSHSGRGIGIPNRNATGIQPKKLKLGTSENIINRRHLKTSFAHIIIVTTRRFAIGMTTRVATSRLKTSFAHIIIVTTWSFAIDMTTRVATGR